MTEVAQGREAWGSDFFGGLNELPPEPVGAIDHILEAMATLPAFREARQWALHNLGVASGGAILEAGSGNGASLADIRAIVKSRGRIVGVDPTKAFVETAKKRAARQGVTNAQYDIGDIRALAFDANQFDGCFCDKVLIHAGPAAAALAEMARVTKPHGGVGAIEWLPRFALSATDAAATAAFNAIFPKACYDIDVSANLPHHFRAAGLQNIRVQAFIAHATSLEQHPFWRAFLIDQVPLFVHANLIDEKIARAFIDDMERLSARGGFSASFIVQAAIGTKAAA
jgi:ubiquinone/menaquinone biosynthesis C-methylase UbiE